MYHYKARVYSPTLGRFLQTDPVGYDDQVNLYAYVANDPVNGVDPTGMANQDSPFDCVGRQTSSSCSGGSLLENGGGAGGQTMAQQTPQAPPGIGHNGGPKFEELETRSVIGGLLRGLLGRLGGLLGGLVIPANETPAVEAVFPENAAQIGHIFRSAAGHYSADTQEARFEIKQALSNPDSVHVDRFGNIIAGRINPDGTQTWVSVRNTVIQNAGKNFTPQDLEKRFK